MAQADEHYTKETLRFHFKKIRKIEHCKNLLRRVGIPVVVQTNSDQTTVISVRRRDMPMWLRTFRNKRLGWWLLNESADIVFDELVHWDGYRSSTNSIQYTSTVKENADVIQALACLSGRTAVMLTKRRPVAEWSTTYVVNIWTSPGKGHDVRIEYVSQQHYAGRVYCAETKTGYFLTRRDGKVWITGNSGQLIQGQNLSRNYLRNLDLARDLVRRGNREAVALLFGDVGDTLSQRRLSHPRGNCSASRTSPRSRRVCLHGSRERSGCLRRLTEERTSTARPHPVCFMSPSKNTARTVTCGRRARSQYLQAGIKADRTHSSAWVHSR